ncbi:hypothetical protein GCM10010971_22270 [Silvimonas amylolytica]|uniref:Uncharacterized protein n=2 Tax=Silvimonas amylolytica TaxID=449663 RepID=A0ABQ2PM54_9NEIS|nr:hypothetical protein GCM10010971_22270 [Silvimonas amylolytica]
MWQKALIIMFLRPLAKRRQKKARSSDRGHKRQSVKKTVKPARDHGSRRHIAWLQGAAVLTLAVASALRYLH